MVQAAELVNHFMAATTEVTASKKQEVNDPEALGDGEGEPTP